MTELWTFAFLLMALILYIKTRRLSKEISNLKLEIEANKDRASKLSGEIDASKKKQIDADDAGST